MIGKTISHYKILEKLGEGGMGVVYKAEDTKLKRTVALKFLPAQALENDEERERFIHEARAAAAVDHSNVCTVHEIDKAEGRTFIVMSYVEGRNLREIVNSGPMKLDEAVNLAIQIGEGLAAAHEKGVVHRDIKPANVILTPKGQTKIMDFGLAKSPAGVVVTQASTTLGTVAYMSPEQARGEQPDGRTDIWSLGAVLYEMVTGRRPFRGDYEQAVIYSILSSAPEPVTALRTGVPLGLERVILRCLEKNPDDRYQTAVDLVSDLRRVRRDLGEGTGAAERAREPGPVDSDRRGDALRGSERRGYGGPSGGLRKWALVLAAVAVVAIAVMVLKPYFVPPARIDAEDSATGAPAETRAPSSGANVETATSEADRSMIVVLPFENLGPPENAYFADGMTEEITSRLASVKALGVISRTSAVQYERAGKTIKDIGEDLGVDYVLEGTVRWDGTMSGESRVRVTPQLIRVSDDTHLWAESYDRELRDIFSVQSDIAEQVVGQMGVTLLEPERGAIDVRPTQNIDAYHSYLRGLNLVAGVDPLIRNLEAAQRMFEEAVALDPGFAQAYAELSKVHSAFRHFGVDRSEERSRLAEDAALKAMELAPDLPEPHIAMGYYYYWALQEYDKALREFKIADGMRPNDPQIIQAEGYILRRKGSFDEAIELFKRSVTLSPRDPNLFFELGTTHEALREYEQARDYYERSIALAPIQMLSYGGLAEIEWSSTGDLRKARQWLKQMGKTNSPISLWFWLPQERMERDYGAALKTVGSIDLGEDLALWNYFSKPLEMAELYDLKGETGRAQAYYDSARVLFEGILRKDPERHEVHAVLAAAYAGLGRKEDAMLQVKKALELDEIMSDEYEKAYLISLIAGVYVKLGEYDLAIDRIEYLLAAPNGLTPGLLRLEPQWDPLRDQPRFKELLEDFEGQDGSG
jgi:TolB-like protein/Tfp pilus assembly protein PilF/predicted Ser/Thr protein kinase